MLDRVSNLLPPVQDSNSIAFQKLGSCELKAEGEIGSAVIVRGTKGVEFRKEGIAFHRSEKSKSRPIRDRARVRRENGLIDFA